MVAGSPAHRDHVDFRDHLRLHPERAQAYAALKRTLASRYLDDRAGYTEAKAEFIVATLSASRTGEA